MEELIEDIVSELQGAAEALTSVFSKIPKLRAACIDDEQTEKINQAGAKIVEASDLIDAATDLISGED